MTKSFKSGINIPSGSISGSAIATQSWVTSQGYSTGGGSSASTGTGSIVYNTAPTFAGIVNLGTSVATGSVTTALNSASLAGRPGSYYAPIASPNFTTGASVGGVALATQTFVSTSYAPLASPSFTGTVNLGSNAATGSVSSALNSASLGGTAAASYALLSSANFTAASVSNARVETLAFQYTGFQLITNSSTTYQAFTGISPSTIPLAANGIYRIRIAGLYQSASTTSGLQIALTTPSMTGGIINVLSFTSGSTVSQFGTSFINSGTSSVSINMSAPITINSNLSFNIDGMIFIGATAGTASMSYRSSAGASVTIQNFSYLLAERVF